MDKKEQILEAASVIDSNISALKDNYGLMSQNILAQLRNLVEGGAVALNNITNPYYQYNDISSALRNIDKIKDYKYIYKFYKQLEIVSSHYTLDAVNSEHLVYNYLSYIIKLKQTVQEKLGIVILDNISDMIKMSVSQESHHYEEILQHLKIKNNGLIIDEKRRLYVTKQKSIVVNGNVIYESVLSISKSRGNKSDGILVYSDFELPEHYAIKIKYRKSNIVVNKVLIPITIITNIFHSIYPREFNMLGKIIGKHIKVNQNSSSYKQLMSILDESYSSLLDVIENIDSYQVDKNESVWQLLGECKTYMISNRPGQVILRYLIHTLNYNILYKQYSTNPCNRLSNLYLEYSCIPFDQMPYCTSLRGHNPSISVLLECIDYRNREHEFLSRFIQNKASQENQLYVSPDELSNFHDLSTLVSLHNRLLYRRHEHRQICKAFNNYLYIKGNEESLKSIMKELLKKCAKGVDNHEAYTENWISNRKDTIDSEEKKTILKKLFSDSHLSLIVGPAGTGKTTLINYISELYNFATIKYIANTNAAVENIKRKVLRSAGFCQTAVSFYHENKDSLYKCNILIIDECSTIPNNLIAEILRIVEVDAIILVGDIFQLGAIEYGNWFSFAQKLLPEHVIHELKSVHRSANPDLRQLWENVRKLSPDIRSLIGKLNCSADLNESVYSNFADDQIILNLNYDGMYGINNINAIMQGNNKSDLVQWGVHSYKIGDPIIFIESARFENIFFNNLKGKITDIQINLSPMRITFEVEIDRVLNAMHVQSANYEIINYKKNSTIVRFNVFEPLEADDEENDNCEVPFIVSYATSIHKAQGLEYDAVKIIITNDNIHNITHDVFYTAVTRAKNKLTIYWTKDTEEALIEKLTIKNINRDLNIFKLNTSC